MLAFQANDKFIGLTVFYKKYSSLTNVFFMIKKKQNKQTPLKYSFGILTLAL